MKGLKLFLTLSFIFLLAVPGLAASPLDGKTTVDGIDTLIFVALLLFVGSLAWIKIADGASAISVILMALASILSFDIANVYVNGSLVQIMPDSTIQLIHNDSTSQFFQFVGLVTMGLTIIQVLMLVINKRKPIFVKDTFGDIENE